MCLHLFVSGIEEKFLVDHILALQNNQHCCVSDSYNKLCLLRKHLKLCCFTVRQSTNQCLCFLLYYSKCQHMSIIHLFVTCTCFLNKSQKSLSNRPSLPPFHLSGFKLSAVVSFVCPGHFSSFPLLCPRTPLLCFAVHSQLPQCR